jgi:adenylate cyclase
MNTGRRDRVERRLAAVLAADVAGYSRLMNVDEEGTLRRLNAHRGELLDPKISEHHGRIVKTTGDGLLVEFPSVVDAVRCAAEIQRAMIERNSETAEERRIAFRLGINLGDVIVEGDDIFGDGVNIAARLEALAEPGGICISATVRDHIGDRLPYPFDDMGEQSVKNIARPVRAYAMGPTTIAATPLVPVKALRRGPKPSHRSGHNSRTRPRSAAARPAPRMSIVVLPFANLSNDPEQEYFADAITDDLTTDLSRIVNSFVIARTTAFTYKGKPVNVKQIGHELGVRYVLEGSVRRLGEQVQVNVQLVDTESGAHIWADRFDTDRTNLANAQNEITGRLARSLQLELLEAVGRRIEQEKPVNPDAIDLVMRGWALFNRPVSAANQQEALRAFERALAIDPESVDARVGIAWVLGEYLVLGWSKSPEQDMARSDQLLGEALERNRRDPRALSELGRLRRIQNRLIESQIELEKAITFDRNNTRAMQQSGITQFFLGQPEEALPQFEKALRLNPHSQNI